MMTKRFQHAKIEAPLKKAFSRTKMMIDRAVMQIEAKECWTTPETRVEWLRMCGLWLWRDSDTSTFKKPPKILHFIVICLRRIGRLSHSHLRLLCQFVTHSTLRLDHSHRCPTSTGWTKEESCVVFFLPSSSHQWCVMFTTWPEDTRESTPPVRFNHITMKLNTT